MLRPAPCLLAILPLAAQGLPSEDGAALRWLEAHRVPVLGLGILREGRLREVRVLGRLGGRSAPRDTIFNVASLAKPVTAMVALRLVDQGRWDLDAPLSKHWVDPDLAGDPRLAKLTTRAVLTHQTGFPNWRRESPEGRLAFLAEPGTRYQYSGEGFEYLRRALEKAFGKSLSDLAQELVFKPLDMRDTRFIWDQRLHPARLAPGFRTDGTAYPIEPRHTPNGADDLLTTVEDYGRFLEATLNGRLLSPGLRAEMARPLVATKPGKAFGLGWERYDLGGGAYALAHGGSDEGVCAQVFLAPGSGDGLLIFTNADGGHGVYEPLIRQYLGEAGKAILRIETGR